MQPAGSVVLRDVEPADIPLFFAHQDDDVACAMAAFPRRDAETHAARWERNLANPDNLGKTILVDGAVVGHIVSWSDEDMREVGYWIDRAAWGRGIASAALAAYLDVETTRPLYAYVAAHNAGSIRVLEKCGFQRVKAPPRDVSDLGLPEVEEHLYRLDA